MYLEVGQIWIPKDPNKCQRLITKLPFTVGSRRLTYVSRGTSGKRTISTAKGNFEKWIHTSGATLFVENTHREVVKQPFRMTFK